MFDIANGKIVVLRQAAETHAGDAVNVERARGALLERGRGIIDAPEKPNCDRRVLEGLKELQGDSALNRRD